MGNTIYYKVDDQANKKFQISAKNIIRVRFGEENGLELATVIYGRVVLETTIKEFAKEHYINSESSFDQIIINLRKNDLIQKPFENSLRANYEIGSWAAHGNEKFNKLTQNEIKEFLVFIRDKVLTLK